MIQCRYYRVNGVKLEACFFHKGDCFPDTDDAVPQQGVWARPAGCTWGRRFYLGGGWQQVTLDPDVIHFPGKKP